MSRSLKHSLLRLGLLVSTAALPLGAGLAQDKPAQPDPALIQKIFTCMQEGLPETWQRAWVVITELSRNESDRELQGNFFYASSESDAAGQPLTPCKSEGIAQDLYGINKDLMREYREATLVFYREGKFELRFENPK